MPLWQLVILSLVQGVAELLPISSSAHVIVTEKLLGLDPTAPQMTLLLVMLHTGTMFAAIAYFWSSWRETYFSSRAAFRDNAVQVVLATVATGVVGLLLLELLKQLLGRGRADFEIETLFGNAGLMALSLIAAGVLIIWSSLRAKNGDAAPLDSRRALAIGALQGVCLPFRGFSRSGATISLGMLLGVARRRAEEFSFALAVVLTPAVIFQELHRLKKAQALHPHAASLSHAVAPALLGMLLSFLAGLIALRWLSRWLEAGRWHYFGIYCLAAALLVLWVG
jgi:undecaprenyl-diphosphatase